jgi:hypothetical protein
MKQLGNLSVEFCGFFDQAVMRGAVTSYGFLFGFCPFAFGFSENCPRFYFSCVDFFDKFVGFRRLRL